MAATLGTLNPFRYRSYVYDQETHLYYLQSRYYNPEIGRFINADSQLNQKDGILGYNMFAYCHNNPIMYSDPTGHSITLACIIIGAVIGAVAGGCAGAYISKKQTGKVNGWAVAAGAVGGGVVGGLVGWGVGAAITAVGAATTGSAATAAAPVVQQVAEKASITLQTTSTIAQPASNTYYQVTSFQAAQIIADTGKLIPSPIEKSVCVLDFQPSLAQAQQIGARACDTVIRFSTKCTTFIPDISIPYRGGYRNLIDGAITIFDVIGVGFK